MRPITLFLLIISVFFYFKPVFAKSVKYNFSFSERDYTKHALNICVDTDFFFPYTFVYKSKPVGIHADLTHTAINLLEYKAYYHAYDWLTCEAKIKSGEIDGIISVSYDPMRSDYISYPDDANLEKVSKWRLTQVAFYPVTAIVDKKGRASKYRFNGDIKTLPEPVRVEFNSANQELIKKNNLKVKEFYNVIDALKDLAKKQEGSVLITNEAVMSLRLKPEFKNKILIHQKPVVSRSYFLGFSKNSKVSRRTQRKIWEKIQYVRNNPKLSRSFMRKYGY